MRYQIKLVLESWDGDEGPHVEDEFNGLSFEGINAHVRATSAFTKIVSGGALGISTGPLQQQTGQCGCGHLRDEHKTIREPARKLLVGVYCLGCGNYCNSDQLMAAFFEPESTTKPPLGKRR